MTGAPAVQPFDFRQPSRLGRDRRAALEGACARGGQALQTYLAGRLRLPVDVAFEALTEEFFDDFLARLGDPCTAFVYGGGMLPGSAVITLAPPIAFFVVNRLFGSGLEDPVPARPLTALEQAVIRPAAERLTTLFAGAVGGGQSPTLSAFEAHPAALAAHVGHDVALTARFAIRCGAVLGAITFAAPLAALESDRRVPALTRAAPSADWRAGLELGVRQATLTLSARLPAARLPMSRLASLEVGQVLGLGIPTDARVNVYVNDRLRFHGTVGRLDRRVGLHITDIALPDRDAGGSPRSTS